MRWGTCLAVLLLGASACPRDADASDPKELERCASASEQAQLLRLKGRLVETRAELLTCSRATCPAVVRKDCDRWLSEVDDALPSIVVTAGDRVDVVVSVDGRRVADRIDGKALAVDPGPHEVVLESAGRPPIKRSVVLREGEKRRAVDVTFDTRPDAKSPGEAQPHDEDDGRSADGRAIVGWSAIGAAAVAAGVGTYFFVRQASDFDDAKSSCAPFCAQDKKDDIDTMRVYSGIAFAVAGAALVTGIVILVTQPAKRTAITDLRFTF